MMIREKMKKGKRWKEHKQGRLNVGREGEVQMDEGTMEGECSMKLVQKELVYIKSEMNEARVE